MINIIIRSSSKLPRNVAVAAGPMQPRVVGEASKLLNVRLAPKNIINRRWITTSRRLTNFDTQQRNLNKEGVKNLTII